MKVRYIIKESAQALRMNKLRSSLTVIGIVVGIFAVTAMLALGEGLQENIVGRISSFTQGDVSIQGPLTHTDFAWVQAQPYTRAALASATGNNVRAVVAGEEYTVTVQMVLGDFATVQPFTVTEGTAYDFTDLEYAERVLVATKTFDDAVREDTGQGLVGRRVTVGNQQYEVVGIIDVPVAGFSRGDGTVYVPYQSGVGVFTSTSNFSSIGVLLEDNTYFEVVGTNLAEGLNRSRSLALDSEDLFSVSSAQSIIESVQETTGMISLFLGIVGGIALFVGGIGTMNMMLTTVSERTKEIGLRKAIGARRRDILLQILFESVFLTFIGGLIGILLTYLLAVVANRLLADSNTISVIVSPSVVALATVVAVAVGVVFGLYPASRASKLQPVDALRAE